MAPALRRSRRGQPSLPSETSKGPQTSSSSSATPIHTRRVHVAEDLTSDQWNELLGESADIKTVQTHFYAELDVDLDVAPRRPAKAKRPSAAAPANGDSVLRVGDTVLVGGEVSSHEPSVAVVTGIVKVTKGEEVFCVNVRVHWFVRPSQLPSVRAKRAHEEAEIYYTLSGTATLPVTNVLARCTVTSSRKIEHSALDHQYCCYYATNTLKGLFYDIDWENHRAEALKHVKYWEALQQWDVTAINPPETPKKQRQAAAAGRRAPLPGVPEEDEEEDANSVVGDPQTPSRRKRKREQDHPSPTKRVKAATGALPSIDNNEEDGEGIPPALKTPSRRAPATPSRRGRGRVIAHAARSTRVSSKGSPRKKRKTTGSGSDDSGSEFEAPSEQSNSEPEVDQLLTDTDEADAGEEPDAEPEDVVPRTPSRRKRGTSATTASTPRRRRRTTLAAPTPHSKAALRARAKKRTLAVRPPAPDAVPDLALQLENVPKDPWLRAMHVLHVAARPEAQRLPCREQEYARVLQAVEELIEEGSGGCIYISGVPGTGKTATVHAVVRELKRMAEQNEANPFTYVEINGLRIPEPSAAYNLLWEAVSGHNVAREGHLKISAKESLKQLGKHFGQGERFGPGGHACVVLMDELDQLMTAKQDVVYNFFNWPTLLGSKLVVLAVANTMDLPERVMSGRVRSRLGMVRINFQPYTTPQLEQIVKTRLQQAKEGLPADSPDVIAMDGIKFAAMKVSSISGDARRVLDICRRAVELVQPQSRTARTDDVKRVIVDMQNSPTAAYLRDLSFHERLMLAALLRCIKREGVEEIKWGDVQRQHLLHLTVLSEDTDETRRPSPGELNMVLDSLVASRAILCEEGIVVSRRPEDEKRVVLNIELAEVERVLGEVGGTKWKNALNI